ncbi:MAG: cell wall-binding repeat-containing protein [Actinobacteria bacterium]|nr:cell wall-binding repeat-containing protein [Actinomycetota bacterium]
MSLPTTLTIVSSPQTTIGSGPSGTINSDMAGNTDPSPASRTFTVDTTTPDTNTPAPVSRLSGASRYGTAAAIALHQFPNGAETVYLARADNVVDAVAGGVLTDGPVLLVPSCGPLPDVVIEALRDLDPSHVTALGGPTAICPDVLAEAEAL